MKRRKAWQLHAQMLSLGHDNPYKRIALKWFDDEMRALENSVEAEASPRMEAALGLAASVIAIAAQQAATSHFLYDLAFREGDPKIVRDAEKCARDSVENKRIARELFLNAAAGRG